MPLLRLSLWEGRSAEEKSQVVRALTEALVETTGVPPETVIILIEEQPKENWASGGELHSVQFPDR